MDETRKERSIVDTLTSKRIGRRDLSVPALLMLILFVSTILAACAQTTDTPVAVPGALLPEIKERGVLKVCVAMAAPWVMKKVDGTIYGQEPDVANAIADRIGDVNVEFIEATWANLVPSLQTGMCDVIISGVAQTEARKEAVDFSNIYDRQGSVFLYHMDNEKIKTLDDLNKPETMIVVIGGTATEDFLDRNFPDAERKRLSGGAETALTYEEVRTGRADAVVVPSQRMLVLSNQLPWAAFIPDDPMEDLDPYFNGMAVRKGVGADLLELINVWLADVGETDYWDQLRETWFTEEFLAN